MTSARVRYRLGLHRDVEAFDIPDMVINAPMCLEAFQDAMDLVLARRDDCDPKNGRLTGAFSASFMIGPEDPRGSGRIVYSVSTPTITVWAVSHDHDEAYRRARKRYKRVWK